MIKSHKHFVIYCFPILIIKFWLRQVKAMDTKVTVISRIRLFSRPEYDLLHVFVCGPFFQTKTKNFNFVTLRLIPTFKRRNILYLCSLEEGYPLFLQNDAHSDLPRVQQFYLLLSPYDGHFGKHCSVCNLRGFTEYQFKIKPSDSNVTDVSMTPCHHFSKVV